MFFAAGRRTETLGLLAAVRLEIGERCGLIDQDAWEFVWVVDAPMFERVEHADGYAGLDRDPPPVHRTDG